MAAAAASSSDTVALGTGCADGTAALWSEGGKLLRKLEGHTDRLGRVAFHPMGMHFVSGAAGFAVQVKWLQSYMYFWPALIWGTILFGCLSTI